MKFTTLISTNELNQYLDSPGIVIIDCRFSLADSQAGFRAYRHGHIPHARYVHLDNDLSSATNDRTGRHPLPNVGVLSKKLGMLGIDNVSQVVAYDDTNGAFACRLWWLLRSLGHENVAVLDGDYRQWLKQGFPTTTHLPNVTPKTFRPYPTDDTPLSALEIQNGLAGNRICLIDARSPERFRGELEPIDTIAGHIPGAVNRPFHLNLDNNGLFLKPENLRTQFTDIIGNKTSRQTVHMCGSGVTACHNLLAMEIAGLKGSKLYSGSWSEWIRDKNRPIARMKER